MGASGSGDYTLDVPDTYELSESGFPAGENIDDKYDWVGCLSYDDLAQDGDSLVIYGDLAAAMSPRFDSTEATKVGSIYDSFAVSIEKATKKDEQDLYTELEKEELAVEIGECTALLFEKHLRHRRRRRVRRWLRPRWAHIRWAKLCAPSRFLSGRALLLSFPDYHGKGMELN